MEIVLSLVVAPTANSHMPEVETRMGPFRVGACRVDPDLNRVTGPAGDTLMEPKAIAVLAYLAERPGKVVSIWDLTQAIWQGRPMGDNPVYRCISQLRRALGDNPRQPRYIATVTTKGYRLVAAVEAIVSEPARISPVAPKAPSVPRSVPLPMLWRWLVLVTVLLTLLSVGYWQWRDGVGPLPSPPVQPSLAVLPFESVSASTADEYLADGISEGVLNRLAALGQLQVIARTSSFSFKDSSYELPRIARLLGVQYILQGQIRREGDGLRIAVELVDRLGNQVWSGTFAQAPGREDFSVRDEIAAAVVSRVAPQILPLPRGPTQSSFEAYQHYLIGHELMIRRPLDFAQASLRQFDMAINIDPQFAEAYAERAAAAMFAKPGLLPEAHKAWVDAAWRDVEKALKLKPDSAVAHAVSGLVVQSREPRDVDAAEASLRRALALDPYMVNAWNWLSAVLEGTGRFDESDEALRFAAQIDPLAPTIGTNLARHEFERGQFEASEARLRRLMQVPQPARLVTITLIEQYICLGRFAEALEFASELVLHSVNETPPVAGVVYLAWTYMMLGAWERAEFWLNRDLDAAEDPLQIRLYQSEFGLHFGHPGYARSAQAFEDALNASQLTPGELPEPRHALYGALLALAGDYRPAIEILARLNSVTQAPQLLSDESDIDVRHALAWAWLQNGESVRAQALLTSLQDLFRRYDESGRLVIGWYLLAYARNELLLGQTDRALDLLEQAERAGWRDYYHVIHDPRWEALRGTPRFQKVMARVKDSIDTQRAQIEEATPESEFIERLDAAIRASARKSSG